MEKTIKIGFLPKKRVSKSWAVNINPRPYIEDVMEYVPPTEEEIIEAKKRGDTAQGHYEKVGEKTSGTLVVVDQFVFGYNPTDYDRVVSHIIRERYSADRMEALLNNYLLDADKYKDEFAEMQEWRAFAKESAKKIVSL